MMKIEQYPKTLFWLKELLAGMADLAWPDLCLLCERQLMGGEHDICLNCQYEFPLIKDQSYIECQTADRFLGKIEFVRATSGFRYSKGSKIQTALELLKYKGEKELGVQLSSFAARHLSERGFFTGMDAIVPVPLHPEKQKRRGYNQSEYIARGLSSISGLPVCNNLLYRKTHNPSQTTRNLWHRWENAQGLFELKNPEGHQNQHLLLVDDVLTSGSTLEACARVLERIPDCRISFFALALA
jgi:ComF family protein